MNININLSRRILKKIIKYLILFIIGCIVIFYANTLNVKAYTYENNPISNIQPPAKLAMYDLTSVNTYSAISFSNYWHFSSTDSPVYYSSSLNNNITLATYGMGIVLQSNMALQKGSTYSLTMVFGTTSNSYILGSQYSAYGIKVGVSDGWNAISRSAELISSISNSFIKIDNSNFLPGVSYLLSYNVTFKPNYSGSYIFTAFGSSTSTTLTPSNWEFLGYYLNYVGDSNVSAGDIAASVDATLQDDFATVDDKLAALDKTLSDVGTSIDEQTQQDQQQHEETMDTITGTDTSGADEEASGFFNDFENNDFGLSDILTLPLTTIQSITSKSCTPLSLTLPFVNKTFELPCMTTIYSKFEPFYSIYKTITFGIVSYWVCVQIYAMVKGFKDPTSDEIEVMDL